MLWHLEKASRDHSHRIVAIQALGKLPPIFRALQARETDRSGVRGNPFELAGMGGHELVHQLAVRFNYISRPFLKSRDVLERHGGDLLRGDGTVHPEEILKPPDFLGEL